MEGRLAGEDRTSTTESTHFTVVSSEANTRATRQPRRTWGNSRKEDPHAGQGALLPPGACTRARISLSRKCSHLQYWHQTAQACVPCETGLANHVPLHGLEFTVNCGMRDTGGRFATPSQECPSKSFNDGRFLLCQPCSQCPPGAELSPCTRLQDARCCPPGQRRGPAGRCQPRCCFPAEQCHPAVQADIDCNRTAEAPDASLPPCWPGASPRSSTWLPSSEVPGGSGHPPGSASAPTSGTPGGPKSCSYVAGYGGYVAVLLLLLVLLAGAFALLVWTQRGWCSHQASSPMAKPHPLLHPQSAEETSGIIAPAPGHAGLWGAPLQHLLDDADVLEELIMLLDPEGKAGGGTRHLAARYGLSATWIDYAYSLRSTRSPLRATLETVAARQPDATLGQLAGLLAAMGRKDALQVLEGVQVGV
ncbi:large proline-rich protein BAG6 [Platysternon megacephalum]|uniref:Large proline-rich protein BAG6 n=1 Tax=Platysternon megacephalum TaxID=55544 RepID=A0A4D9DM21_9SAUR|nr:large proline-rich protein BAG6 [Platysternon megacephalum]